MWTYAVPTATHRLAGLVAFDVYAAAGLGTDNVERPSYLGVVTLALVYYAAVRRVSCPNVRFWWLILGRAGDSLLRQFLPGRWLHQYRFRAGG